MAYIASRRRRGSRRMPQRNDEPDRVATWRTYARAAAASSAGREEVASAVGVVIRAGPLVGGARRGSRAACRRLRQCRTIGRAHVCTTVTNAPLTGSYVPDKQT